MLHRLLVVTLLLVVGCASTEGQSFDELEDRVTVYYAAEEVERPYLSLGTMEATEAVGGDEQLALAELVVEARNRGADAMIVDMAAGTTQPSAKGKKMSAEFIAFD